MKKVIVLLFITFLFTSCSNQEKKPAVSYDRTSQNANMLTQDVLDLCEYDADCTYSWAVDIFSATGLTPGYYKLNAPTAKDIKNLSIAYKSAKFYYNDNHEVILYIPQT